MSNYKGIGSSGCTCGPVCDCFNLSTPAEKKRLHHNGYLWEWNEELGVYQPAGKGWHYSADLGQWWREKEVQAKPAQPAYQPQQPVQYQSYQQPIFHVQQAVGGFSRGGGC